MECQKCDRKAVVHITELSEGQVAEQLHLCQHHAETHLQKATAPPQAPSGKKSSPGTANPGGVAQPADRRDDHLRCPVCGTSFEEVRKTGRLGCPNDYEFFWPQLESILMRVHGELEHTGKTAPDGHLRSRQRTQLIRLRRELREAVQVENYERAGQIRDQIHHIEHPIRPPFESRGGLRSPSEPQSQQ